MQGPARREDGLGAVPHTSLAVGLGMGVLGGDGAVSVLAVGLVLAAPAGIGNRKLVPLALWLLGGALVGGLIGWGITTATAPTATTLGVGLGLAVGGGFGAVVKLISSGEEATPETETVDLGTDEEAATATPQPLDLFDEHPDPLVYFDDTGEGPVVRAVNDAFGDTFGVDPTTVEGAPLGGALMVTERADEVVAAARAGDQFDAVLECETGTDTVRRRVRVVATSDRAGGRGYVLYSE